MLALLFIVTVSLAEESTVGGKALYTDNLALPKDAKFEVVLEDISVMDMASVIIGQTTIDPAGQIPIDFTITFDDKDIVLGHRYAVRAKLTRKGHLLYVTDTVNPVFVGKDNNNLNLIMKRIYKIPESRMMEGLYKYMADAALFKECVTGKYYPVAFEGDNIALEEAYMKESNGSADFLKVELKGKIVKPQKMDGEGKEDTLLVEKFIRIDGKKDCSEQHSNVPISNNYWKLVLLNGQEVKVGEGQKEAHILLKQGLNGIGALKIVTGCNEVKGNYKVKDLTVKVEFDTPDSENICENEKMEKDFLNALRNVRYWNIKGEKLQLLDERDNVLTEFNAVFF
jgi:uncharacterized lipoprotein YbaY/heat shock protein HslJ